MSAMRLKIVGENSEIICKIFSSGVCGRIAGLYSKSMDDSSILNYLIGEDLLASRGFLLPIYAAMITSGEA